MSLTENEDKTYCLRIGCGNDRCKRNWAYRPEGAPWYSAKSFLECPDYVAPAGRKYVDVEELLKGLSGDLPYKGSVRRVLMQARKLSEIDIINRIREQRNGLSWIRPAGTVKNSYRFQCPYCNSICYEVTGNNGRKRKTENPQCTYRFCPHCGERVGNGDQTEAR